MLPRTIFLSRLLGLWFLLLGLVFLTHAQSTVMKIGELVHNTPVLLLWSIIALAAGLALVLGHNIWSGGLAPILVTILGWLLLIKSLLLLFLPTTMAMGFVGFFAFAHLIDVYAAIAIVLGALLAFLGFRSKLE
jgi:hypothetical protein